VTLKFFAVDIFGGVVYFAGTMSNLKSFHLKLHSWILLAVMLTVTLIGVYESAAGENHLTTASAQAACCEISAPHHCPFSPLEQHQDYDGCDSCDDCGCHAPLGTRAFLLSYNPVLSDRNSSDPFKQVPEVYLSKFVPPQNLS
jgi:hypothetical protein